MASNNTNSQAGANEGLGKIWLPEIFASPENVQIELNNYTIPKLACSNFPEFLHPLSPSIRAKAERWLRLHGLDSLLGSETKVQKFLDHEIWTLTTRTMWDATPTRLKWISCLYVCHCVLDDLVDDTPDGHSLMDSLPYIMEYNLVMMWTYPKVGRQLAKDILDLIDDPEQRKSAADSFNDILTKAESQPGTEYPERVSPLGSALLDLWSQASGDSPEDFGICFMIECHKFAKGLLAEAKNRSLRSLPSIPEYMEMRRITGCMRNVVGSSNAYISKLYLPYDIFYSPSVDKILNNSSDVTNWTNDIYSLPKELLKGDVHNLVLLISIDQKCSLTDAAQKVADMIEEKCNEILELKVKLEKETSPEHRPAVDNLIQKCLTHLRGFHDAHRYSPRYWSIARAKSEDTSLEKQGGSYF